MKSILVDTNILINFLRGKAKARDFLLSLAEDSTVYCSVITVAEIFAGIREHERQQTVDLLDSINIVTVTREIAEKAGMYKSRTRSQGLELDDCFIAATAYILQATLATGNAKHYPMDDIDKIRVVTE
ncbi:MAG: type II toxin-antitoxin system VapC family toxin [Syntrophorhabdaceae bacterium]|nr:type II toxin-antitoxin system VapC family toxin [Syntrophorhabdaceae bacterium]MDD5242910.1 type II toxin-antitoxin system VapC family toxin [Syntrophorhabdaceae bacterium]